MSNWWGPPLILVLAAAAPRLQSTYVDSAGAFSVELPAGWSATRSEAPARRRVHDSMTLFEKQQPAPVKVTVLVATSPQRIEPAFVSELAVPYIDGWLEALKRDTQLTRLSKLRKVTFLNRVAVRCDVSYLRGDANDPRTGYALVFAGVNALFMLTLTGSANNQDGLGEAERILSSLKTEPRSQAPPIRMRNW